MDPCKDFVEACPVLGVDDHLVRVKIKVNLVIVFPDGGRQLQQFVQVFDVRSFELKFKFH